MSVRMGCAWRMQIGLRVRVLRGDGERCLFDLEP